MEANTTSRLDDIFLQLRDQAADKDHYRIKDTLTALAQEGKAVSRQQILLQHLHFNSITLRHDAIKRAHAETFKWMFESPDSNFRDWLQSGQGVYWIAGKAGSGKSTLMKWLLNWDSGRESTLSNLQMWAGTKRIIIGAHFFWSSGSSLQKSEEGLLRSLLFQLFKECPALVEKFWPDSEDFDHDWGLQSLRSAVEKISQIPLPEERFCIFIDGLDEYSDDHQELISTIQGLASSPSIKVCASSRPWNAFNNAFGRSINKLKLEDLTRDDIKKYVTKNLTEDINFKERESSDPLLQNIAEDVSARAQGVFLWVYLVVHALKKALIDGARLHEMQELLDNLPSDLEQYFQQMIESIEPQYRQESVRIFKFATVARQPLPVIAYEFVEKEIHNPDYALEAPINPYTEAELKSASEMMRKRLNARCKDLLEVVVDRKELQERGDSLWCYTVHFLHRTVLEFFRKTDNAFETLGKLRIDGFDVKMSLCRALVALQKASPYAVTQHDDIYQYLFTFVYEFTYHARDIETQCLHENAQCKARLAREFALVDEMDRVNTLRSKPVAYNSHWANHGFDALYDDDTFLSLMIQHGLTLYVDHKLENYRISNKKERPLLAYALLTFSGRLDPSMVKLFLQRGANPNQRFKQTPAQETTSPWIELLNEFSDDRYRFSRNDVTSITVLSILRLLLEHGADPDELTRRLEVKNKYGPLKKLMESSEMKDLLESAKERRRRERSVFKKFRNSTKAVWARHKKEMTIP